MDTLKSSRRFEYALKPSSIFSLFIALFSHTFLWASSLEQEYHTVHDFPAHVHERDAEDFVARNDAEEWIPKLCDGLNNSGIDARQRARLTFYLGAFKSEDGARCIVDFIDKLRCDTTYPELFFAIMAAMNGLGLSSTEAGIQYLTEMSTTEFWETPCEASANLPEGTESISTRIALSEKEILDLRCHAYFAIAAGGTTRALEVLTSLLTELADRERPLDPKEMNIAIRIHGAIEHVKSRLDGSFYTDRERFEPSYSEPRKVQHRIGQPKELKEKGN